MVAVSPGGSGAEKGSGAEIRVLDGLPAGSTRGAQASQRDSPLSRLRGGGGGAFLTDSENQLTSYGFWLSLGGRLSLRHAANNGPWVVSHRPPVFINKVLFEHRPHHSVLYCLWLPLRRG